MSLETQALQLKQDIDDVYEAGKQAEYDRFWDVFQSNGKRTDYTQAFSYKGWENVNFKPKYQLKPTNAYQMFYRNQTISGEIQELIDADFSNCTSFYQTFQDFDKVTRLGVIDMRKATAMTNTFAYMRALEKIDKIIIAESTPSFSFAACDKLANIVFEGVIGNNINFAPCPLTVGSMKSIITHLKDYTGTESEFAHTLTLSSASKTALEAEGATSPNGNTWTEYVDDLGWTLI